jgi:hypothetical protein
MTATYLIGIGAWAPEQTPQPLGVAGVAVARPACGETPWLSESASRWLVVATSAVVLGYAGYLMVSRRK